MCGILLPKQMSTLPYQMQPHGCVAFAGCLCCNRANAGASAQGNRDRSCMAGPAHGSRTKLQSQGTQQPGRHVVSATYLHVHLLLKLDVYQMRLGPIRLPVCILVAIPQKLDSVPWLCTGHSPDSEMPELSYFMTHFELCACSCGHVAIRVTSNQLQNCTTLLQ
jgi:hypothetical protein